jgi:predicted Rossmann fold nucleotide-binding protein DprA/Smf involved in DNA uptake
MSSHYGIDTSEDFGPLFRQASRSSSSGVQQVQRRSDGVGGALPVVPLPGVQADRPLARRTDPETSHEAARRAPSSEHRRLIVESLDRGPAGQTEIARRTGLTVAQVSKRLCELRRDGVIVRVGVAMSASGGREAMYGRTLDGR